MSYSVSQALLSLSPHFVRTHNVSHFCLKVNICVGAFRDDAGKPWVLPSVRTAEHIMLESDCNNKEYAPIEGDHEFITKAIQFAYGEDDTAEENIGRIAAVQSLSGTGACKVAGMFYAEFLPKGTSIYIPDPTWGNHIPIFKNSGLDVKRYRYYNYKTNVRSLVRSHDGFDICPAISIVVSCVNIPIVNFYVCMQ